jgi:hypothetical protein
MRHVPLSITYSIGPFGSAIALHRRLYPLRATQQRKTRTNIHYLSGIRNNDLNVEEIKAYASDCVASERKLMTPYSG